MQPDISDRDRNVLRPLLRAATLELIPTRDAAATAAMLREGTRVSVTASPKSGPDATLELAARLAARGLHVTPHLSARAVRDRAHLESIVDRMVELGIDEVFVIGGDGKPVGRFDDAMSLLRELADIGMPFASVGVACYPEGHPTIPNDVLLRSLREKEPLATYMTSQMCFDARAILDWVRSIRNEGITLPLRVGVPGAVEPMRLARIAARIGVGQSLRFVTKNTRLAAALVRAGRYDPSGLVRGLVPVIVDAESNVTGLHIFTFNQVAATEAWRRASTA